MTFNEICKQCNAKENYNPAEAYGRFCEWYYARARELGLEDLFRPTYYWWINQSAEYHTVTFIFKPGDLAMYNGDYVVVEGIESDNSKYGYDRTNMFDEDNGKFRAMRVVRWPNGLKIRTATGFITTVEARSLKFADIPQEIFKLACNKASTCPMMGGKENT